MKYQQQINHNRRIWDEIADAGDRFYRAPGREEIQLASGGKIRVQLTPVKRVPDDWLGNVRGQRVLCLACGGGQQGPLFAAAGAEVTVFDISSRQLQRDQELASMFGLQLQTVQGDMADLTVLDDHGFDLIVNPCSVCFCPQVGPIWREAFRVLKPGGRLLAGMAKPINYLFDALKLDRGQLHVRHRIPYTEAQLTEDERVKVRGTQRPLEFGHSLTQLIGAQLEAGLELTGFYEDRWGGPDKLSNYIDVFVATRAIKPTSDRPA